jgi:hypothetical protein
MWIETLTRGARQKRGEGITLVPEKIIVDFCDAFEQHVEAIGFEY